MNTLRNKPGNLLLRPVLLCLVSLLLSGSILFAQKNVVKNSDTANSKLNILEKLEQGKSVSSGEIRDSFSRTRSETFGSMEFYLPDPDDLPPFSGQSHYYYHDGDDHYFFSDSDLRELNYQLHKSLEEVRRNIDSFRKSEDFKIMQAELQKMGEKIRKEVGKIKVEIDL
jgi:hypothetical protein